MRVSVIMSSMGVPAWFPALAVVQLIRSSAPSGLEQAQLRYDILLAELLVRDAEDPDRLMAQTKAELQDPKLLEVARSEYRIIFAAAEATVFFSGRDELSDHFLRLLWRPFTTQIRDLVYDLAQLLDAREGPHPLVPKNEADRARLRRAWREGVLAEVDRMRMYRSDEPGRGAHVTTVIGGRRSMRPADAWLCDAVRDQRRRRRHRALAERPARRAAAQGITIAAWRASAVCTWLAPLAPDFLEEHRAHFSGAKFAELRRRAQGAPTPGPATLIATPSPPETYREAKAALLPDRLWAAVAPIVAQFSQNSEGRHVMLGILMKYSYKLGWNWLVLLPWLRASYSTCWRLDVRLHKARAWPRILNAARSVLEESALSDARRVLMARAALVEE